MLGYIVYAFISPCRFTYMMEHFVTYANSTIVSALLYLIDFIPFSDPQLSSQQYVCSCNSGQEAACLCSPYAVYLDKLINT